jgi:hypothetical protein
MGSATHRKTALAWLRGAVISFSLILVALAISSVVSERRSVHVRDLAENSYLLSNKSPKSPGGADTAIFSPKETGHVDAESVSDSPSSTPTEETVGDVILTYEMLYVSN